MPIFSVISKRLSGYLLFTQVHTSKPQTISLSGYVRHCSATDDAAENRRHAVRQFETQPYRVLCRRHAFLSLDLAFNSNQMSSECLYKVPPSSWNPPCEGASYLPCTAPVGALVQLLQVGALVSCGLRWRSRVGSSHCCVSPAAGLEA